MTIYAAITGTIAGICFGYALLYFFIGWRQRTGRAQSVYFALFAFGYAGTLLMGIWYRSQDNVADYLAISRWDGPFIWLAFVALTWFVAEYTAVKPRWYLWGFTAVFTFTILAAMRDPLLTFASPPAMTPMPLPWSADVPTLIGEENVWGFLLLLWQLLTLGFIIFAGLRQFRRGDRQAALVLLAGMAWFVFALLYEIIAEFGVWAYLPLAETGFLGIAVALSLQMANATIETEEALAASERTLETQVAARTAELEEAQARLIDQASTAAVLDERQRIARDLHDDVTQTLYSAALIAEALPRVWQRDPDEGRRNLAKLRQLVRGALAEMRTLLFELRPDALAKTPLATLLQQLGHAFTGRTRVPVEIAIAGAGSLSPTAKEAFYRITQEALNNVDKHAAAGSVQIAVEPAVGGLVLTIADDGHGFDAARPPVKGMGLQFMRERAGAIGATLTIDSAPRQGTTVALVWPRPQADSEENHVAE